MCITNYPAVHNVTHAQCLQYYKLNEPSLVALEEWLTHQQSKNVLMWELNFVILLYCIYTT